MKVGFLPKVRLQQWLTLLIFIVAALVWVREQTQKAPVQPASVHTARCVQVIDGDTLDIEWSNGRRERVRVLGVDCMDSHHEVKRRRQARRLGLTEPDVIRLSKQATRAARTALQNRPVSLVFPGQDPEYDPYNRLLCYVEYDGRDWGAELLELGLAETRSEPHPRKVRYTELNQDARDRRAGLYAYHSD